MKAIEQHLLLKQAEFSNHPFFQLLNSNTLSVTDFLSVVSQLGFWIMTFQDVLRLNEAQIQDPYLRKVARHHRIEDSGHDRWFLEDIAEISKEGVEGISWLFDKKYTITRDAAYAIIAEVHALEDEVLRVVLLQTLESSGHIFFGNIAAYVNNAKYTKRLKYFSQYHLDVEEAHSMFEEAMEKQLNEIELSVEQRVAAKAMIDRMYVAFTSMFDGLVVQLNQQLARKAPTSEQGIAKVG